MHITVLYVENCPHVAIARQRIAEALERAGVSGTATERLVRTEAEAIQTGFRGSPTILVDGDDPFPADGVAGLSCRLYPGDGGAQGAPTVDQLVEALSATRDAGSARSVAAFGLVGATLNTTMIEELRWAAFDRLRTSRPTSPEVRLVRKRPGRQRHLGLATRGRCGRRALAADRAMRQRARTVLPSRQPVL
jgi:hypothetical protein